MKPSIGRIVHYILSSEDANQINRRRIAGVGHGKDWPEGAQAHVGSQAIPGDVVAAVVVGVFTDFTVEPPDCSVNLHILLDGNDSFWAKSISEGTEIGTWRWPGRITGG